MKKIMVFGATGYIGVYFIDYLKQNLPDGFEIIAIGRRNLDFFKIILACLLILRQRDMFLVEVHYIRH